MAFLDFIPLIGSGLQNAWNAIVGKDQSKDLMRYQYELNQQAIDAQNRYNSPLAQMERLEAAGLNPNLVYGNGVDGNQSSAASVGLSNRNPQFENGFMDTVSSIFKRRQIENETKVADSTRDKQLADAQLSQARYLDVMQDVSRKDATFDTFVEQARANLEHTQQSINESRQRVIESEQRTENLKETVNEIRARVKNLDAKTITELLRPSEIRANIGLIKERTKSTAKQREVMDSVIRLNDKKLDYLFALTEYTWEKRDLSALEYDLQKRMQDVGLGKVSPRDLLYLIKDLLIQGMK